MTTLHDGARATAKRVVERVAVGGGLTALCRLARRHDVAVLAYHNIVPRGHMVVGDSSLHLPQEIFAEQLDALLRTHEVVSLHSLLAGGARSRGRARAIVTFDDAYSGALTAGVEELARRGVPATMFVAPRFIGGASFWWDALPMVSDRATRERALREWRGSDEVVRREAVRGGAVLREPPAHCRCGSLEELRAGASVLSYGAHSWGHPNLARVEGEALREELARPLAWLRDRFTNVLPWIAYPYGCWSPSVAIAARDAGYSGAFLIAGGPTPWPPIDPFAIPRIDVPAGASLDGLAMRVSGLLAR